jgi:hemerythrin-like domain-containing protein
MHALAAKMSAPIRDRFLADHDRLETLLKRLLAAFEANDRDDIAQLWTEFESGLLAHMAVEEACMIPALQRVSPTNARILIQEHRHIRTRLTELGVAIDLHCVRLDTARAFVDELRAHATSEDRLLYQWADDRLDHAEKESLLESFAARLRVRAKRPAPTARP